MTRKPTLIAYTVKPPRRRDQKPIWTRIGAAWPHSEGEGLSIELEALPLDGRVVLIPPKPDEVEQGAPAEAREHA